MERVIVERTFDKPVDRAELAARFRENRGCFEARSVQAVRSCVSLDGLRMLCEYEAPDAESVRAANRLAGLPFDAVWTASILEIER